MIEQAQQTGREMFRDFCGPNIDTVCWPASMVLTQAVPIERLPSYVRHDMTIPYHGVRPSRAAGAHPVPVARRCVD
ncbi:MAG: hypothetical protein AB7O92_15260, partial [Acidimicrobiia bacterium]